MTVGGVVAKEDLGVTTPHEHALIDIRLQYTGDRTPGSVGWDGKVAPQYYDTLMRDCYALRDNLLLDDRELAIREIGLFANAGGKTFVDVTPDGIGRDVQFLKRLAEETGMHVVTCCGYYTADAHPEWVRNASVAAIAEKMIRELTVGIDGTDIRDVTKSSIRQNVGIVQQDVFIFADTILENIRYGKPDATYEEVVRAAKRAEIYDDIMAMPDQFETYVGERGTKLSGGQKQRVSIARIFLKDPKILILDEATSALDTITEEHIQESFEELAKGRTTIVIAHRLSTVQDADRIVVVEDGLIVEEGTHEELLAKNGEYAKLYNA
jgi:energy-coupling factor transporter ATP-binding protein EcfA2